jgi:hypothetical protein
MKIMVGMVDLEVLGLTVLTVVIETEAVRAGQEWHATDPTMGLTTTA